MSEATPPNNGEASPYKKRKRQVLNIKEKCDIIEKLRQGQTVMNISRAYGVCRSTIWGIKHNELKILKFSAQIGTASNSRKTMKKCEDYNMECALLNWYNEQTGNGVVVSNQMICDAALGLNKQFNGELDFKATRGWLKRFKGRHDIGNRHKAEDDISSVMDTEEDSLNGIAMSEKSEDRFKYEWETETANRKNFDLNNATAGVLPVVNIKEELSEIVIDDDQEIIEDQNPPITPLHVEVKPSYVKVKPSYVKVKPPHVEVKPSHCEVNPSHEQAKLLHDHAKPSREEAKPTREEAKPTHEEAFNAIDTVIQWAEAQREIGMDQLMFLRTIQGLAAKRALASISRVK